MYKSFKKWFSVLLCAILLLNGLPLTAIGEDVEMAAAAEKAATEQPTPEVTIPDVAVVKKEAAPEDVAAPAAPAEDAADVATPSGDADPQEAAPQETTPAETTPAEDADDIKAAVSEPDAPPATPAEADGDLDVPKAHAYLTFAEIDGGLEVTACDAKCQSADIPSEWNGLPVLSIGDKAFSGCADLKEVKIPEGVLSIGKQAFAGCALLTELSLPKSTQDIAGNAFDNSAIVKLNAPQGSYAAKFADAYHAAQTPATPIDADEATPAEATPAEATPAEATPAEATPAEATPAEATPAEAEEAPAQIMTLSSVVPMSAIVADPKTSIILSGQDVIAAGKSGKITARVTSSSTIKPKLSWSIDCDKSIATLKVSGMNATITANKKLTEATVIHLTAEFSTEDSPVVSAVMALTLYPASTKVTVTGNKYILDINNPDDSLELTATVLPSTASQAVIWKSSNAAIASVDQDGVVTIGSKAGTATITATTVDGSKRVGNTKIKVLAALKGVSLSGPTQVAGSIVKNKFSGKSIQLVATFEPVKAGNKTLVWSSSDPTVATVNNKGKVTAKSLGSVTITAVSPDDATVRATYDVDVIPVATSVTISGGNEIDIATGNYELQLTAVVQPTEGNTAQEVTWKSSNAKTASVDENGLVTALKPGKVTITATAADGSAKRATQVVTVLRHVQAVTIAGGSELNLNPGKAATLKAAVAPADSTNKKIKWETSDNSIATVSSSGKVVAAKRAVAGDTVTITAVSIDGSIASAPVTVTVTEPMGSFTLSVDGIADPSAIDVSDIPAFQLVAKTEDGADALVTYKSSSSAIATIDANGLVTPKKAGKLTITATAIDGSKKSAKLVLVLTSSAKELVFTDELSATIAVGKSITLKTSVSPSTATDKTVNWATSDARIATVAKGKVTGKSAGTATITASKGDLPCIEYTITVMPAPTKVTVTAKNKYLNLALGNELQLSASVIAKAGTPLQTVVWKSSNASIATIDENGLLTATGTKTGYVTITATTVDLSNKKGTFKVNVFAGAERITLKGNDEMLSKGKQTLTATLYPLTAKQDIVWTTSDKSIATVNAKGVVTANKKGVTEPVSVTITASSKADPSICATHDITIRPTTTSSITLSAPKYIIPCVAGHDTLQMTATCEPVGVSGIVSWSSSNTAVATIDENGLITGLSEGQTTITALATDGSNRSARKYIRVVGAPESVLISGVAYLAPGGECTLSASFNPVGSVSETAWESSNPDVASIDQDGHVKVAAAVDAITVVTFTATPSLNQAINGTHSITIYPAKATAISLDDVVNPINFTTTKSLPLVSAVLPANACPVITWSSSDNSVATVEDGVVTLLTTGDVTITAMTNDGSDLRKSIDLNIIIPVTAVAQIVGPDMLISGQKTTMKAVILPEDATNPAVDWSVDKNTAALIDAEGLLQTIVLTDITIITITATSKENPALFATKEVALYPAEAESIDMGAAEQYIDLNNVNTLALDTKVLPAGSYQKVLYTSSDKTIATLSAEGVITGVGVGTAEITASAIDGSDVKATIKVHVEKNAYTYTLTGEGITLDTCTDTAATVVVIPDKIMGEPVVAIGEGLFKGNTAVTSVALPGTILEIPNDTFNGCSSLSSVTMSNDVTRIGQRAFKGCAALADLELLD